MAGRTLRESDVCEPLAKQSRPGVVVVFSGGRPTLECIELEGGAAVIGRDRLEVDTRLSREHVRVERRGDAFVVTDLGSRNGTRVDGARIDGPHDCRSPAIIRAGYTLALLLDDVAPLAAGAIEVRDATVIGPRLAAAWELVEQAARAGGPVMLTGESGAGKELAARVFHERAAPGGPLIAVNCAAIPSGVAERLLFGAKRGAYSGASADSDGYVAAAHNGTLFLDEVVDLDLEVQAKLLRVLETGQVLQLGASHPRSVSVRVVAASLRDARHAVANKRFREDLYYRIGQPLVQIPPLRDRPEEIPWLIASRVSDSPVSVHVSFVEACLLRPWPGNARELLREVSRALAAAAATGRDRLIDSDLNATVGMPIEQDSTPGESAPAQAASEHSAPLPSDAVLEHTIREERGNVTRTAHALGLHRNQVRRWLTRHPDVAEWARAERQR